MSVRRVGRISGSRVRRQRAVAAAVVLGVVSASPVMSAAAAHG